MNMKRNAFYLFLHLFIANLINPVMNIDTNIDP